MFMCEDCGREFESPKSFEEYRGECHGSPAYETLWGCPFCKGDYFEIKESESDEE